MSLKQVFFRSPLLVLLLAWCCALQVVGCRHRALNRVSPALAGIRKPHRDRGGFCLISEVYGPVSNPFMIAVYQGRVQDVDRMLGPGANLNTGFPTSCNGNLDLGLPVGDDSEASGDLMTPLENAVAGGHLEMVEYLLKRGADPNFNGPLFGAVYKGNIPMIRLLLRYGASVDQRGYEGDTAMLGAIQSPGGLDVIKELIAAGADVHATDNLGDNAVMEAAYYHELEIFKFFVGRGVDACAQDHENNTALFYADLNQTDDPGRDEIIAYLKEHCTR